MITIYSGQFPIAGHLKTLLEAKGITVFLHDEVMSTLHPVVGQARLAVRKSDAARAEKIAKIFLRAWHTEEAPSEVLPEKPRKARTVFITLAGVLILVILGLSLASRQSSQQPQTNDRTRSLNLEKATGDVYALYDQGLYAQASSVAQESFKTAEKHGRLSIDAEYLLGGWASAETRQGHDGKAIELLQRLLQLQEKRLGPDNPELVDTLARVASLLYVQGQYQDAESAYLRIIQITKYIFGPEHYEVVDAQMALRNIAVEQGNYDMARQLNEEVVSILTKRLGPDHLRVLMEIRGLAYVHELSGNLEEAGALYKRVLSSYERQLGQHHPLLASVMRDYAAILRKADRLEEAEELEAKSRQIYSQTR
ncbi:MAG: tetratricopeptide repeat protein [Candidatus Omnitrophica bacterium]|nr:tetratricopeptide repeat protein [Candidatus Omnitrophota bacterium]